MLLRRLVRLSRFVLPLAVLALVAGCAADVEEVDEDQGAIGTVPPERDDAVGRIPWQPVGVGVSYKRLPGGSDVLVVYGGYGAQDVYAQRWANELVRAKGQALGLGHVYAVRGPNQPLYANREIGNSRLAAHLDAGARSIVVVAHSSGSYVANELFGQLSGDTLAKTTFFNLDGGRTSASTLGALADAYFVFACDGAIGRCSQNAPTMRALASTHGGAITVRAEGSGCSRDAGGSWCLHDALITTRPHNPRSYDLRRDYTTFGGERTVVASYLDALGR